MKRSIRSVTLVAIATALAMTTVACSSSGSSKASSGSSGSTSGSGKSIKIGVLTDLTGAASSGYTTTDKGIKAYVDAANAAGGVNGHQITYVIADSTSTPTGALTAAQKLVQNDKVFAVISNSSAFFGAEPYLLKQGVPVIGTGFDGTEWTDPKNSNMFDTIGVNLPSDVYAGYGGAMKTLGGTSCGSVGYIESPSSAAFAKAFVESCVAAGLKNGYTSNIHFGSTDVGPIALGMKNAGVDSIYMATVPSSGFALAAALKQYGAKTTAVVLPTGYGADLLASKPAVAAAQGFYFSINNAPVELNTAATQVFAKRLAAQGVTGSPTTAESNAYVAMTGFAAGVKAAGSDLTQQNFIASLRKVNDFDAEGLVAPNKVDFADYSSPQQCSWYLRLTGEKFVPVPGLSPICSKKL
jgi:branched-chain amino acid transport system substrate-binding protein